MTHDDTVAMHALDACTIGHGSEPTIQYPQSGIDHLSHTYTNLTLLYMLASLPLEIYHLILISLVDDSNLGDDFDERVSPYHNTVPPYPTGRSCLATACTRVCKDIYDLAIPIIWQHLIIRRASDLELLCRLSTAGSVRPSAHDLPWYTRRVDFQFWQDSHTNWAVNLLLGMRRLHVLVLENRLVEKRKWRSSCCHHFLTSLSLSCPRLRRLQFLSTTEVPSLRQLAAISQSCKELRALQLVSLDTIDDLRHAESLNLRSLRYLSIGTGHWSRSTMTLLKAIRSCPVPTARLERLNIYLSFESVAYTYDMEHFHKSLYSSVLHLAHDTPAISYGPYSNLQQLTFVLHISGHATALPSGLRALKVVEFVTEQGSGMFGDTIEIVTWNRWMLENVDEALTAILDGRYPSLETVTLWERVPGNHFMVRELLRRFERLFLQMGVTIQSRMHHRYTPVFTASAFLRHLTGSPFESS